jgi:AbrB family looped-hinge helix DNA binding protein
MKKSEFVVVRKKGVIVLPKEVRDKLGVEEGDMLRVKLEGERIVLIKEDFWNKLFGCAKGLYDPDEAELELDRGELG